MLLLPLIMTIQPLLPQQQPQPLQRQHKSRWKPAEESVEEPEKIHEKAQGLSNNCAGTTCWYNYKYQNWRG